MATGTGRGLGFTKDARFSSGIREPMPDARPAGPLRFTKDVRFSSEIREPMPDAGPAGALGSRKMLGFP